MGESTLWVPLPPALRAAAGSLLRWTILEALRESAWVSDTHRAMGTVALGSMRELGWQVRSPVAAPMDGEEPAASLPPVHGPEQSTGAGAVTIGTMTPSPQPEVGVKPDCREDLQQPAGRAREIAHQC